MRRLFVVLLLTVTAFASTQGPSFPGTVTTVSNFGGNSWTGTTNLGSTNGAFASCVFSSGFSQTADNLLVSNFGFTIPTTATINGITVSITRRMAGSGASVQDSGVQLLKALATSGSNKAVTGVNWPTTFSAASYGSASDLWTTTWTPTDINGTGFGVQLATIGVANGVSEADVDSITITVTFTSVNNFTKTAAETVTISPAVGLNRQSALSDSPSVSPVVAAVYGASRSTPESLGLTPTVSYIHGAKSTTSDTLAVSDSPIRVAGLHFSLSETLGVTPSILVVFPRFANESLTLSDTIAIRQAPKRTFSESVSLSISGVGSAAGIRALSEGLTITDTSIRQVGLGRGLSDSGAFTDTFTRFFGYRPGPIEVVNITGIVNLGYAGRPFVDVQVQPVVSVLHSIRPLISESLVLSPTVIASLPRFKLISETLGLAPVTRVSHASPRFTFEISTMKDVLSSTTVNVTPHSEKNTIGQSVTLSELLVVSVRSGTKKRAVIVMSL